MKLHEIEFVAQLSRIVPNARPVEIESLLKMAQQYQALQVAACNYELTTRQKSRERNLQEKLFNLILGWGISGEFGGDPRGYTVKLFHPDFTGGWERGTLGVPTKG